MSRALLLLLAGCATSGTFQTADTLGPKGWEVGGDISASVLLDTADVPYFFMPRGVARVGVSERVDLGASFGFDGARFGPKIQLTPVEDGRVIVSVAPGIRVLPLPAPEAAGVLIGPEEALLVGVVTGERTQLVFTVRSAQDFGFVGGNTAFLLWAGGSIGFSWQVTDGFRLMPEVGAMSPVLVLDDDAESGFRSALVQVGVGAVAGRRP